MTIAAMIDLETTGTAANAGILSIGVAVVDLTAPQFQTCVLHYEQVKLDGQTGRICDGNTLWWWMQQSEKAREVFNPAGCPDLLTALNNLSALFEDKANITEVWSNGADFDIAILQHAYQQAHTKVPWSYKHTRCFRTLKALYPQVPEPEFAGTTHNALDDAIHQAEWLYRIRNWEMEIASNYTGEHE